MNKLPKILFGLFIFFSSPFVFGQQKYLDGVVFAKIKTEYLTTFEQSNLRIGLPLSTELNVKNLERFAPQIRSAKGTNETPTTLEVRKIYRLYFSEDIPVHAKIKELMETGYFEYVEPSYIFDIQYQPNDPLADSTLSLSAGMNQLITHDFYSAWDIEKGDTNIVIGVVDTGVNFEQLDSKTNLKYNYNDTIDGINNDLNDYQGTSLIDDYRGWDVADWDNDPTHGTGSDHGGGMISIIAATPDNDTGMVGTGFNCKYRPYKAAPDAFPNAVTSGYDAMYLAALQGCQVINCSWGQTTELPQIFLDITNYVTLDLNSVVVSSAGNSGQELDFYPASFPYVLSVCAIGADKVLAVVTSDYSYHVDLAAVGHVVKQALAGQENSYKNKHGTSVSAAIVSGLTGLVRSHFPEMNALQVRKQILVTADYIDTIPGNEPYAGKIGKMINPVKALSDTVSPGIMLIGQLVANGDTSFSNTGATVPFDLGVINLLRPSKDVNYKISAVTDNFEILDSIGILPDLGTLDTLDGFGKSMEMRLFASEDTIENFVAKIEYWNEEGYLDHDYWFFDLYTNEPVGIEDQSNTSISISPIPFKSIFTVNGTNENTKIELFDIQGNKIAIVITRNDNSIDITPKTELINGTYLVKIINGTDIKVIKTRKI